jgi:hypothetical protein
MTETLPDAAAIISGVIPRISRASRNCKPRCLPTLLHLELNLNTNIQTISPVLNVITYIKLGLLLEQHQDTK